MRHRSLTWLTHHARTATHALPINIIVQMAVEKPVYYFFNLLDYNYRLQLHFFSPKSARTKFWIISVCNIWLEMQPRIINHTMFLNWTDASWIRTLLSSVEESLLITEFKLFHNEWTSQFLNWTDPTLDPLELKSDTKFRLHFLGLTYWFCYFPV